MKTTQLYFGAAFSHTHIHTHITDLNVLPKTIKVLE